MTSATGLPELVAGVTPSDSPDGPMIDLFGQAVAPVSPSAPQANSVAQKMSATYGLRSSVSSASAALQHSWVNKLQERLDSRGSTMFSLTWKAQVTPLRRQICRLAASALRTGDSGCGGWPTPDTNNCRDGNVKRAEAYGAHAMSLHHMAASAWPTPTRQDQASSGAAGYSTESGRHSGTTLTDAARMTGWATPTTRDWKDGATTLENTPVNALLGRQVLGAISLGSPAQTERRGQLNPRFSGWLMNFPIAWDIAAMEIDSSSRRSSKARKTE
jgi:hypothetical protein